MFHRLTLMLLITAFALCAGAPGQADAAAGKAADGFKFPPIKVPSIQWSPGQAKAKPTIFQFGQHLGKTPIALFYFLPQHGPSITELRAFAMASQIFAGKVQFVAVTKASNQQETDAAYAKLKALKIKLPVLLDAKGMMAYVMLTRRVPAYALITKQGKLKLARASKLSEKVTPSDTLLSMITRMARGEDIPFIRAPGYSPNPYDLIGKRSLMFKLPRGINPEGTVITKPKASDFVSLRKILAKGKPVLLVFWSVTCPHCKRVIPVLDKYVQTRTKDFNTVSVVIAHNKKLQDALQELQKTNNFKIPILNDHKGKAMGAYKVMMVPTIYFLRPDGRVYYVNLGGGKTIGKKLDAVLAHYKKHGNAKFFRPRKAQPRKAAPRKAPARRPAARPASRKAAARKAPPARRPEIAGPMLPPRRPAPATRKAPTKRPTSRPSPRK